MSILIYNAIDKIPTEDTIKIQGDRVTGTVQVYLVSASNYYLAIIPSLNISSYGDTENKTMEGLDFELKNFCEDLVSVTSVQRNSILDSLGWKQDAFFKKRLSHIHVDKAGALVGLDIPEDAKISVMSTLIA